MKCPERGEWLLFYVTGRDLVVQKEMVTRLSIYIIKFAITDKGCDDRNNFIPIEN